MQDPRQLAEKLFGKSPFLMDAAELAIELHGDQTRADGKTPYACHVISVAGRVYGSKWGEALVCTSRLECTLAAMFHDVLEDRLKHIEGLEAKAQELKRILIERLKLEGWSVDHVVGIVKELTQDRAIPWKERRKQMVDHCGDMTAGARLVKLADRLDNVSDMRTMSRGFRERYCREARAMVENMGGTCPGLEHQLVEMVTRQEIRLEK